MKRLWHNLTFNYWRVYFGLRNLWFFKSAVWHFDDCSYEGLLKLMRLATARMAHLHEYHGHLVKSERTAKELRIVSELCRRLGDDSYEYLAGYSDDSEVWNRRTARQKKETFKHARYLAQQDAIYLGKMFRKIQYWWD